MQRVLILYLCYAYKAKALMTSLELVAFKEAQRSPKKFQFHSYLLKTFKGVSYVWPMTILLNSLVLSLSVAFLSHRSICLS